jgi:hypothetical protein
MRAGFLAPGYLRGAVLAAGCAGAIFALAGLNVAVRGPLVLLFLVAAPALAIAGWLRGLDRAGRIIVALTSAIVLNALVAETMLAAGAWSPRAGLIAVAGLSAAIAAAGLWKSGLGFASPQDAYQSAPDSAA